MKRIYGWCLNKVRSAIGAVGFLLPRVHVFPPKARKMTAFRRRFVTALFAVLAGALIFSPTCYSSAFGPDDFTYTGTYTFINEGTVNGQLFFRIKFTTSGTFTPNKPIVIDAFLVGGGGGGKNGVVGSSQGGGGGGGYAGTWTNIYLTAGQAYIVTVGNGGAANGGTGGTTSVSGYGITTMSKAGGTTGALYNYGGNGGSGGGSSGGGVGGSDGSKGGGSNGGTGQGTTTREFGEAGGDLYSGAGGGGAFNAGGGAGGAGGGGAGGGSTYSSAAYPGVAGTNNLGGGGGGGGANSSYAGAGAAGGSGICIFRNHR